jgi:hypothetical protein
MQYLSLDWNGHVSQFRGSKKAAACAQGTEFRDLFIKLKKVGIQKSGTKLAKNNKLLFLVK